MVRAPRFLYLRFALIVLPSTILGQHQQPMTVDNLFTLEQLGQVVASPNGEWLAVVIARPRSGAETYRDFPWGPADADHADIWLLPRQGGERRNITNGSLDGSGYWSPVWSPDSKRLALLSTRGGDDIRPYVWEATSGTLRRLSERGFDMRVAGEESWPTAPLIWVDSTTLICPLRPEGAPPSYYSMSKTRSLSVALDAWTRAASGEQATASALESARTGTKNIRPQGQLVEFEVSTGQSRVLTEGNFFSILLSPTRRHVALIAENGPRPPSANRKLRAYASLTEEWWHTRLALVPLARHARPRWIVDVVDPVVGPRSFLGEHPSAWSPDGSSFAVIGKTAGSPEAASTVFVVDASTGQARPLETSQLEVQKTTWCTGGELLTLARPRTSGGSSDGTRWDWWVTSPGTATRPRNATARLPVTPAILMRLPERHRMLGLVEGDLWAIDVRRGTSTNLTARHLPEIHALVWPAATRQQVHAQGTFVVRGEQPALYRIDWNGSTTHFRRLRTPTLGAELTDFHPARGSAVFTRAAGDGTSLWSGDPMTGRFERRFVLNSQLRNIADARPVLIEYRGLDGDSLRGVVLLPVGYERGRRYPLIAWVYPGTVVRDTAGHFVLEKGQVHSLNLNLLAARGYAVLVPSMPLRPEGSPSDPYLDLPKGVIPAIDKLIDLGIADSRRLGVMGHSYGGYGTYALVTYTNRFKAAVALAGQADLVSLYGAAWNSMRYDEYPDQEMFFAALAESGQNRMGGPPWTDIGRYLRNSPYYYMERVQTPLMIIHGDMDYVPIQQGEQFFTGLYRLHKEAELIRYWGEGHVISAPANMADLWQRILAWFDEHLKAAAGPGNDKSPSPAAAIDSVYR
jgi:dipeptidyl aminopeptidase/acylaminoacyl peptidase